MASTYSNSLKIQLMANGEDSGTWGTNTNTNWNLIEQAVAGVVTIPMSNANYTMSNLNGVSDEARNMVLNVTGTNSAIYQVIAPLVSKFYIVSNNTSGGYAITIGASTGATVTIPNGITAQVYCDGSTGFFSAQTGSAGSFLVNGNLSVGGNLNVTGTTNIIPVGVIQMWPTTSAPSGFLLCAGAAVSRTTYSSLFGVIGTTFGAGDGSTTFNLPNYTNRMPYGTTIGATGGSADATLVSHSHTLNINTGGQSQSHNHNGTTDGMNANNPHNHGYPGHLNGGGGNPGGDLNGLDDYGYRTYAQDINHGHTFTTNGASNDHYHNVNGSTDSAGGSATNANLPPYLGINFIIKT